MSAKPSSHLDFGKIGIIRSNTVLRHNQNAVVFHDKFPIITINYEREFLAWQEDMKKIIQEHGDVQKRRTNVQANMTSWYLHKFFGIYSKDKENPRFKPMSENHNCFEWLGSKALGLAQKHNPHEVSMEVSEMWGADYDTGDYSKEHEHWPSLWSFVFYVDCCNECAPLVFPTTDNVKIIPKIGCLTLFPAWVLHSVPIQTCEHNRIMVAGNIGLSK